jgi:hypothetical protein
LRIDDLAQLSDALSVTYGLFYPLIATDDGLLRVFTTSCANSLDKCGIKLYYTDEGAVRALPCETLEQALSFFNTVAKRFSPAWICAPEGKVLFGNEPEGFRRTG